MAFREMHYLILYLEENYDLTNEKKIQSAIKLWPMKINIIREACHKRSDTRR